MLSVAGRISAPRVLGGRRDEGVRLVSILARPSDYTPVWVVVDHVKALEDPLADAAAVFRARKGAGRLSRRAGDDVIEVRAEHVERRQGEDVAVDRTPDAVT